MHVIVMRYVANLVHCSLSLAYKYILFTLLKASSFRQQLYISCVTMKVLLLLSLLSSVHIGHVQSNCDGEYNLQFSNNY